VVDGGKELDDGLQPNTRVRMPKRKASIKCGVLFI
jgi:hypothetical protein